jgi:hypothetical protein
LHPIAAITAAAAATDRLVPNAMASPPRGSRSGDRASPTGPHLAPGTTAAGVRGAPPVCLQ